jgi:hypothetical protein
MSSKEITILDGNVTANRFCQKCNREQRVKLVRNITSNGASQVYWLCQFHDGAITTPRQSIAHDKLRTAGIDINLLPVIYNNSVHFICAVCGAVGAANHHFAPRFLFGDECEKWAQDYLCEKCHARWHNLVTPGMSQHGKL